jgi:hypothetical protein
MKQYKLHNGTHQSFIIDVERNAYIPFDPANTDYQAFLRWCDEGNVPEPADEVTE